MSPRRVVVTGLGALTPIGNSVPAYWEGLISGTSGAAPITYFDPTDFKTQFACELKGFNALDHFDRKEARKQDRFSQYAIVSSDEAIKDAGLIAVCNFAIPRGDKTREGHSAEDACKMMEDLGADVVGLNCYRGPEMTMKLLKKVRDKVSCHVAGLPVPYRTTEEEPGFLNISDHGCDCIPGGNAFPVALDNLFCNLYEMAEFAKDCVENKINFIGICCGAEAHHVREMSVAIGKKPISMKYMPDMSKHFHHGTDSSLKAINKKIKY